MEATTGFNAIADQSGFVVAYLDYAPPVIYDAPNIATMSSLIDQLTARENIDPRRVYV